MVDKLFTVPTGDIGSSVGCLETTVMAELEVSETGLPSIKGARTSTRIANT